MNDNASRAARTRLRVMALSVTLLLLFQAALGMAVNLYARIPARHLGADPRSYFSGSLQSVGWAIAHGTVALVVHAALGLALAGLVIAFAIIAVRHHHRGVTAWSSVAALLVIGAGFNGASFLDFHDNTSSLIMALLAFAALACYSMVMFHFARTPWSGDP